MGLDGLVVAPYLVVGGTDRCAVHAKPFVLRGSCGTLCALLDLKFM